MGWEAASQKQLVLQPEICQCNRVAAFDIAMGFLCQRARQYSRVTGLSSISSSVSVLAPGKGLRINNDVLTWCKSSSESTEHLLEE